MSSGRPTRTQSDLADLVEMLLDKGIVINADIVVSVGEAELLGIQLRAAIASFETAAQYGLQFPEGTDMERVEAAAAGRSARASESKSKSRAAVPAVIGGASADENALDEGEDEGEGTDEYDSADEDAVTDEYETPDEDERTDGDESETAEEDRDDEAQATDERDESGGTNEGSTGAEERTDG